MILVYPEFLWLLVLAALVVVLSVRHHMGVGSLQAVVVTAARVVVLALVILALTRPILERADDGQGVVYVIDGSESIDAVTRTQWQETVAGELAGYGDKDQVFGVLAGDAATALERDALGAWARGDDIDDNVADVADVADEGIGADGRVEVSDIENALQVAGALLPGAKGGRVVLMTDGRENRGNWQEAGAKLAQRGVEMEFRVGGEVLDGAVLREVRMPTQGRQGATVMLTALIEAAGEQEGELTVREVESGEVVSRQHVMLDEGMQEATLPIELTHAGAFYYDVELTNGGGVVDTWQHGQAGIWVRGAYRIGVLEGQADAVTVAALQGWLGGSAELVNLNSRPLDGAVLASLDAVVLANVSAGDLRDEVQEALLERVREGMGLLVSGGQRAFGPGGYAESELAKAMPVSFSQGLEQRDPSTTLVVIIDTSGSMTGSRVDLAKEIARLALGRLKPHDKAGIVEFYGSKRWAAPIQPASNAIDLQRALNRLSAGGGTVILPAIEEAYYGLLNTRTRTRHVLVLTDGGVETGQFEPLIRKMAERGITVSTVLVGPGTHSAFLTSIAQWGRGRFYCAPDRFNLPEIILKQPDSSMLSPYVQQLSQLVPGVYDPMAGHVDWESAPEISGYVETALKPTADLLVESSLGHPILATWQYGLGRVAVLTTELTGAWTEQLGQWEGYGKLVANICRGVAGRAREKELSVAAEVHNSAVRLHINQPWAGNYFGTVDVRVLREGEVVAEQVAEAQKPYQWSVYFDGLAGGAYEAEVVSEDRSRSGRGAWAVTEWSEYCGLRPDKGMAEAWGALQKRFGGDDAEQAQQSAYELWPILVIAALVIFMLMIILRRWHRLSFGSVSRAAMIAVVGLVLAASGDGLYAAEQTKAGNWDSAMVQSLSEKGVERGAIDAFLRGVQEKEGDFAGLIDYLKEQEQRPGMVRLVALAEIAQGNLAAGRDALARLSERDDVEAAVLVELSQVEELMGREEEALAVIEKALGKSLSVEEATALRLREVLILYEDEATASRASALLAELADESDDAGWRNYCGMLAGLNGDYALGAVLIEPIGTVKEQFQQLLFKGHYYLKSGEAGQAREAFEAAEQLAPLRRDARFAIERIIASARQQGGLDELANEWLADDGMTYEKMIALITVLRELGRSEDGLALIERFDFSRYDLDVDASLELQREVVAMAVDAGAVERAARAYEMMLERAPGQIDYLMGLARLKMQMGGRGEAEALFGERVSAESNTGVLMTLAEAARRLGLDEVALEAAGIAGHDGATAAARAVVFEADLRRERGDVERGMRLLRQARDRTDNAQGLMLLAEAFERFGDQEQALRLYRLVYEKTGAEDCLLRIAWLLEETGQFESAYELWREMWDTTTSRARSRQAKDRMLDLASRNGKLADLAIDLEEALDAGHLDSKHLELLVDIYTVANDPVSAAEILYEFGRQSGDEVATLNRLVRVYLGCEQFGRCDRLLRRLAEIDPENALDYYQQIAVIALERQQPHEARRIVRELEAMPGAGDDVDEFAAGVLNMIGLYEDASHYYAKIVARNPDRIESLLMWANAMKQANKGDQAVARFQYVLDTCEADDLFTIAVDGLLNLEARPEVMAATLRRVYTRIAASPKKVFLYRLAVDLEDVLRDHGGAAAMLEHAVLVGGERRAALLRELMDTVASLGDVEAMVDYGRSLTALGDVMPPQVFLDLGEALVKRGDLAGAERVFNRASLEADYASIQERAAYYYEQEDMPQAADRIIRELLAMEPSNVDLLVRSAGLGEQMGAFNGAFEQYLKATDLMLSRLPVQVGSSGKSTGAAIDGSPRERRRNRSQNIDEITRYFPLVMNGLLVSCRDEGCERELVGYLEKEWQEDYQRVKGLDKPSVSAGQNPRFDYLSRLARRVLPALYETDRLDEWERALVELYPKDDKLKQEIMTSRLTWGYLERAKQWAGSRDEWPATLKICEYQESPGLLIDDLDTGKLGSADLAGMLPRLIITGQDDEARAMFGKLVWSELGDNDRVWKEVLAAAIALNDETVISQWCQAALEQASRISSARETADWLEGIIPLIWPHADEGMREQVFQRVAVLAEQHKDDDDGLWLGLVQYRLARYMERGYEQITSLAKQTTEQDTVGVAVKAELLGSVDAEDRASMLRMMVQGIDEGERRQFMMELAGELTFGPDELFVTTFDGLYRQSSPLRYRPTNTYSLLRRSEWNTNSYCPGLGLRIGEVLLSETPDNALVAGAVAIARGTAGLKAQATALAEQALDSLFDQTEPDFQGRAMLNEFVAYLFSPDDLERIYDDLSFRAEIEGESPMLAYSRGMLLEALGRVGEAATLMSKAYGLAPQNRAINRKLIGLYEDSGDLVSLQRLLRQNLTTASPMESFEWRTLADTSFALARPRESLRAAQRNQSPLACIEVMRSYLAMGEYAKIRTTLMRFLVKNRMEARHYTPFWANPVSPRGMQGYKLEASKHPYSDRLRVYEALAEMPWAYEDYMGLLRGAYPDQGDVEGLVSGIVAAAVEQGQVDDLIEQLRAASEKASLHWNDFRLLLGAVKYMSPEGAEWAVAELDRWRCQINPDETSLLLELLNGYQQLGAKEQSKAMLRWLAGWDGINGYSRFRFSDRLSTLDDYLALCDDEQRSQERARYMTLMQITPFRKMADEIEEELLRRAIERMSKESLRGYAAEVAERVAERQDETYLYHQTRSALATAYIVLDDLKGFEGVVETLLRPQMRYSGKQLFWEYDRLLPDRAVENVEAYVEVIVRVAEDEIEGQRLSPDEVVKGYALLIRRLYEGYGESALAERLLAEAGRFDSLEPESALWVADAAAAIGQTDIARGIELSLLQERLLPVSRGIAVLEWVEAKEGEEAAGRLAVDMAGYSDHSVVLVKALGLAEKLGNNSRVKQYRRRLKDNWGEVE